LEGALENPAEARRFLSIIERHAERLGRLVDDLLTLSDLELGRAELRRGPVHAQAVFEAVFEILHAKAARAGLVLEQDVAGDLELLDADSDRLEQALLNLVDNAVKYTRDGGRVKVSARSAAHLRVPANVSIDRRRSFTEIAVADTGIGIPSQDLPRLTERFYRVDKARSREMGGTGLGLAIVKHIVHAHGGWMEIESELNRGTTVRLFLPNALRDEAIEVGQGASVASAPKRGST
jgi:two-component system phosphate regulon sensor histidine kinase PhoR